MNSTRNIPAPLSLTGVSSPMAAAVGPSPLTWRPALAGARYVHGDSRPYGAPPGLGPLTPALSLSRLASVPLPLTAFWLLSLNPSTRRTRGTASSRGNALGLPENADQRLGAGEWAARATGATASSPSPHPRAQTTRAARSIRFPWPTSLRRVHPISDAPTREMAAPFPARYTVPPPVAGRSLRR